MIDETKAFVLQHFVRFTTRRDTEEILQFQTMPDLARKIAAGLWRDGLLDTDAANRHGITPAGRAALRVWRLEHGGDWPRPPWRRKLRAFS